MRAVVTGQIGMDKADYLRQVVDLAGQEGDRIDSFHVGKMMYEEAPDVRDGRILDLPISRLASLRRAAFKDIINRSHPIEEHPDLIVNTHATFRWRHGLFSAFDFDQMQALQPNMFVCLVDNIEMVHARLHKEHEIDATLKDCMVWREEEILSTELLAQAMGCPNDFYILSRGRHNATYETCRRLVTRPEMRKVYPSFPMSHVVDMPDVLAEIAKFRAALAEHFITFDPADVDEKLLLDRAIAAAKEGQDFVDVEPHEFGGGLIRSVFRFARSLTSLHRWSDLHARFQADRPIRHDRVVGTGTSGWRSRPFQWSRTRTAACLGAHQGGVCGVEAGQRPSPFITRTANPNLCFGG